MAFSRRITDLGTPALAAFLFLLPQPAAGQVESQLIGRFGWEQTRMSLVSTRDNILIGVFAGSDLITVLLAPDEALAFADSAQRLLRARPPLPQQGPSRSYSASTSGGTPHVTLERKLAGMESTYTLGFSDQTGAKARIVVTPIRVTAFLHALRRSVTASRTLAASPTGSARPVSSSQTYFEFQVEKPVATDRENPKPVYPEALRGEGTAGEVIAQFVVDEHGRANMHTFKILRTSHHLFTEAVRSAVPNMQFTPAEIGGRKVKQLVQQPFHFAAP